MRRTLAMLVLWLAWALALAACARAHGDTDARIDALLRPYTGAVPGAATDDPAVRYGFGWRITGETLWHSGETVGFRNVIIRCPRRHFTVIVLTNRDEPEPYPLALAIAKLYLPDADAQRAARSASGPDPLARPLPANGK